MKIVQEIGSYAGLAAIFGLAVLAALYFSQARDVRRLREWAGRAPERAPETGGVPAATAATPAPAARPQTQVGGRAPVRPVPRAPGQTGQQPVVRPSPAAAAAAAAAGATPATATGPAAATPAARAADAARTDDGAGSNGTEERSALDQDTVIHPPPPLPGEDSEEFDAAGDSEERDALTGESAEVDALEDEDFDSREVDALDDDEEWDEDSAERDALPPEAHWEDTGDQPVPVPPRRVTPVGGAVGASAADSPSASGGGSILPPYEESRPGGPASASDGGRFGSRGRGLAVIGVAVIVLAVVVFGATRLLGGDDSGDQQANVGDTTGQQAPARTSTTPQRRTTRRGAINPANVRVAVLNGTTVPGLAAQIGDDITRQGFKLGTVTNFNDQQRAESVVLYAPGAEREAAEVGRRLKISQREPIDAESQGVAGDASVAVVTGRDKTP